MKIILQKVNACEAKLTLELNEKTYTETWEKEEDGQITTSLPILSQLDNSGVEYENGLVDMIYGIQADRANFLKLCSVY